MSIAKDSSTENLRGKGTNFCTGISMKLSLYPLTMSRISGSEVIDFHTCKLSFNLPTLCCSWLEEVEVESGCSHTGSSDDNPAVRADHNSLVLGISD